MRNTKTVVSELTGFVVLVFALFLFGAAISGGGSRAIPPRQDNLCGPVGEAIVVFLWDWIGQLGVWGLIFLLGGAGSVFIGKKGVWFGPLRVVGAVLFSISLAVLEYLLAAKGGPYEGPFLAGGKLGYAAGDVLKTHLRFLGAFFSAGTGLVIALSLTTDILLAPEESYLLSIMRKLVRFAAGVFSKLRIKGPAWGSAFRLLRALSPKRLFGVLSARRRVPKLKTAVQSKPGGGRTGRLKREVNDLAIEEPDSPSSGEMEEPVGAFDEDEDLEYEEEEEVLEGDGTGRRPAGSGVKGSGNSGGRSSSRRRRGRPGAGYVPPSVEFLKKPKTSSESLSREQLKEVAQRIEETLQSFKIDGHVVEVQCGPVITQYEVLLAPGIKVHRITNLASELAMALKARRIRIVAPIPGKNTVGIEVPNPKREIVRLRDLIESDSYLASDYEIPLLLGKDGAGSPVVSDLTLMPHLLIAGATGSGKSVCLNSLIITALMTHSPEELKLILVDPKMVELSHFADIPHLLCPVVTDMKKAPAVLAWLVGKMDERYETLAQAGVRNIVGFNALGKKRLHRRIRGKLTKGELEKFPAFLPYLVLVVDELADLMMSGGKEAEAQIIRLAQKSRAVGIHVVLATQRPSVDVITGLIKSNMPSRIAFHVSSKVDSRTILDRNGAEALLGRGDMLFLPPGASELRRVQSCFVSDSEIRDVVKHVQSQAEAEFDKELEQAPRQDGDAPAERDELYAEAVRIVLETQRGSATLLQRRLEIGYTRASRLVDMMAEEGIVGPYKGSKAREVYYTLEEWEDKRVQS